MFCTTFVKYTSCKCFLQTTAKLFAVAWSYLQLTNEWKLWLMIPLCVFPCIYPIGHSYSDNTLGAYLEDISNTYDFILDSGGCDLWYRSLTLTPRSFTWLYISSTVKLGNTLLINKVFTPVLLWISPFCILLHWSRGKVNPVLSLCDILFRHGQAAIPGGTALYTSGIVTLTKASGILS